MDSANTQDMGTYVDSLSFIAEETQNFLKSNSDSLPDIHVCTLYTHTHTHTHIH
jgi:hypothetical protein